MGTLKMIPSILPFAGGGYRTQQGQGEGRKKNCWQWWNTRPWRWARGIDDDGGHVPLSGFVFLLRAPPHNHTHLKDDTLCLTMHQWGVNDCNNTGVEEGRRIVGDGGIPSLWIQSGSIDDDVGCVPLFGLVFLLYAPPQNHTKSRVGLQGSSWEETSPDQPCRHPPC
jgi:hypothetical protein